MHAKITNNSKANQGIYTEEDGLVFIEPGKTRTLTIAASYVERAQSLPFLKIVEKEGKHAEDEPVAELTEDEEVELVDAMTEDELRAFVERKTGHAPHPRMGREKLLAKARGE